MDVSTNQPTNQINQIIYQTGVEGFKSQLPANTNFGAAIAELPDLSGDNQTEIAVGCYVASNARYVVIRLVIRGGLGGMMPGG